MENKLCLEGYMSEVQFARAISSLNSAERVPITLRYYPNGEGLFDPGEPPPHMVDEEALIQELIDPMDDGIKALEQAIELAKQAKVKKAILAEMEKALRELLSNREFAEEQAKKTVIKATQNAKMEISAFAENVVRQYGLAKLGADKALLTESPSWVPETPLIEKQESGE
jgi:hypothetical protein